MTETANFALSVQSLVSENNDDDEVDLPEDVEDGRRLLSGAKRRVRPSSPHNKMTPRSSRRLTLGFIAVAAACVCGAIIYLLAHGDAGELSPIFPPAVSTVGPFKHGVVAADHETCSRIGARILADGGSAVDGAIAALLCIGVVHSFSSGIGGGGFMVVRNATGVEVIDFREVAPAAASEDMYEADPSLSKNGGLAVAVPAELRGFELAHRRHGRLPWRELVRPAAALATGGYRVSAALADAIAGSRTYILEDPVLAAVYAPGGTAAVEGDIIANPALGATLSTVAESGVDAFYSGPIAEAIARDCQNGGGILTVDDIAAYTANVHPAIDSLLFGRFRVYTAPPPAGGSVFLFVLNLVAGFFKDAGLDGLANPNAKGDAWAGLDYHRFAEACKFAYARRTQLADPAYVPNATDVSNIMIGEAEATRVRALITDDRTHPIEYYGPQFDGPPTAGTTHVSVLMGDESVSVTSTINLKFGSRIMSKSTGVLLNNEMDDFSSPNITNAFGLPPSRSNFIRPGKRPMSSSSPAIIVDEKALGADGRTASRIIAVVGSAGGSLISSSTAFVAANILFRNFNVHEAVAIPRIHHQLVPNNISAEVGIPKGAIAFLKHLGHTVIVGSSSHAVVQSAVQLDDGTFDGMSDPRKGGLAAGF